MMSENEGCSDFADEDFEVDDDFLEPVELPDLESEEIPAGQIKQPIFIVRDADGEGFGNLFLYLPPKPTFFRVSGGFHGGGGATILSNKLFPQIKPGEIYDGEIILGGQL